jgi:hypothetical protein
MSPRIVRSRGWRVSSVAAGRTFPASLASLDTWVPPWEAPAVSEEADPEAVPDARMAPAPAGPVADLLAAHPLAVDAVAALLGLNPEWPQAAAHAGGGPGHPAVSALLGEYPLAAEAAAVVLAPR